MTQMFERKSFSKAAAHAENTSEDDDILSYEELLVSEAQNQSEQTEGPLIRMKPLETHKPSIIQYNYLSQYQ